MRPYALLLTIGLLVSCGGSEAADEAPTQTESSAQSEPTAETSEGQVAEDSIASDTTTEAPDVPTSDPEVSESAEADGEFVLVPYVHSSGRMEALFPDTWEVVEGDTPDLPEIFASIDLAASAESWDVDRVYMYYVEGTSDEFAAAVADNTAASECGEPLFGGDPYTDGDKEISTLSYDCGGTNVVVRGTYEMSKGGGIIYWLQYDAEPSFDADFEMVTAITDSMRSN